MGPILFLFGIILGLRWLLWKTADNARRRTNSNIWTVSTRRCGNWHREFTVR